VWGALAVVVIVALVAGAGYALRSRLAALASQVRDAVERAQAEHARAEHLQRRTEIVEEGEAELARARERGPDAARALDLLRLDGLEPPDDAPPAPWSPADPADRRGDGSPAG